MPNQIASRAESSISSWIMAGKDPPWAETKRSFSSGAGPVEVRSDRRFPRKRRSNVLGSLQDHWNGGVLSRRSIWRPASVTLRGAAAEGASWIHGGDVGDCEPDERGGRDGAPAGPRRGAYPRGGRNRSRSSGPGAPRDAERLAQQGVAAGIERIIVVGGDGTLSEVVSGLLGAGLGRRAAAGSRADGNGWGSGEKPAYSPRHRFAALACIAEEHTRILDAGRVDLPCAGGTAHGLTS